MGLGAGEKQGHGAGLRVGVGAMEQGGLAGARATLGHSEKQRKGFQMFVVPYSQTWLVVLDADVALNGLVTPNSSQTNHPHPEHPEGQRWL